MDFCLILVFFTSGCVGILGLQGRKNKEDEKRMIDYTKRYGPTKKKSLFKRLIGRVKTTKKSQVFPDDSNPDLGFKRDRSSRPPKVISTFGSTNNPFTFSSLDYEDAPSNAAQHQQPSFHTFMEPDPKKRKSIFVSDSESDSKNFVAPRRDRILSIHQAERENLESENDESELNPGGPLFQHSRKKKQQNWFRSEA